MAELPTDWDIIGAWCRPRGFDTDEEDLIFDMCQAYAAAKQDGARALAIAPVDQKSKDA